MKQTSIEWLIEQIKSDQNQKALSASQWMQVIEQAKEIHKQEIIDAFGVGCHHESKRLVGYQNVAEQYYNETFNQ